jgi:hypothetical protein
MLQLANDLPTKLSSIVIIAIIWNIWKGGMPLCSMGTSLPPHAHPPSQ